MISRADYLDCHESEIELKEGLMPTDEQMYCPECEEWVLPEHITSYEYSDADGNRGMYLDCYTCPVCEADVQDGDYC